MLYSHRAQGQGSLGLLWMPRVSLLCMLCFWFVDTNCSGLVFDVSVCHVLVCQTKEGVVYMLPIIRQETQDLRHKQMMMQSAGLRSGRPFSQTDTLKILRWIWHCVVKATLNTFTTNSSFKMLVHWPLLFYVNLVSGYNLLCGTEWKTVRIQPSNFSCNAKL